MKAIRIARPGDTSVLRPVETPKPVPGPGEVLIRVAAAGVNRPDILQRQGRYAPPPGASDIPGLEVAGRIEALGDGVARWSVGDDVCALLSGGGYAEYAVAPEGQCLPVPANLTPVEAAGLPETLFTVWANVFAEGRLQPGETLLVHGGSSGIGTMAIQLAKAFGACVLCTVGSPDKAAFCRDLGADLAIDYDATDFVAAVRAYRPEGVDMVLDMVGGDYVPRNLECLAPHGRHVSIAFQRGQTASVDLAKIMTRRLVLTGSTLRPRGPAEKSVLAASLRREVWPLIEAGRVRPIIHCRLPLDRAAEAHRLMENGAHRGKIVLTV